MFQLVGSFEKFDIFEIVGKQVKSRGQLMQQMSYKFQ